MRYLVVFSVLLAAPIACHAQTPDTQIEITAVTCSNTPNGPEIEGELKNISNQPIGTIAVDAIFQDADGKFVSTTETYAKYNPLLPGQTTPYDGFGDANPVITSVSITPALQGGGIIPSTGNATATCQ